MKRITSVLLASVLVVGVLTSLVACSDDSTSEAKETTSEATEAIQPELSESQPLTEETIHSLIDDLYVPVSKIAYGSKYECVDVDDNLWKSIQVEEKSIDDSQLLAPIEFEVTNNQAIEMSAYIYAIENNVRSFSDYEEIDVDGISGLCTTNGQIRPVGGFWIPCKDIEETAHRYFGLDINVDDFTNTIINIGTENYYYTSLPYVSSYYVQLRDNKTDMLLLWYEYDNIHEFQHADITDLNPIDDNTYDAFITYRLIDLSDNPSDGYDLNVKYTLTSALASDFWWAISNISILSLDRVFS